MSISLKALYDQVQSISNKSIAVEYMDNGTKGYANIGELQIRFGRKGNVTSETFLKPFSTKCICVCNANNASAGNDNSDTQVTSYNVSGFSTKRSYASNYIAIGYLITNRLLGWVM